MLKEEWAYLCSLISFMIGKGGCTGGRRPGGGAIAKGLYRLEGKKA